MSEPRIPFDCPSCGDATTAVLLRGALFAHPNAAALECECGVQWRVGLYEVEDEVAPSRRKEAER